MTRQGRRTAAELRTRRLTSPAGERGPTPRLDAQRQTTAHEATLTEGALRATARRQKSYAGGSLVRASVVDHAPARALVREHLDANGPLVGALERGAGAHGPGAKVRRVDGVVVEARAAELHAVLLGDAVEATQHTDHRARIVDDRAVEVLARVAVV
ncbi:hypothetical protein T492DRAFT_983643 [Pavlovales sp. CCMP2436]|nr:hypothetical protein T492DRAFT_983643 [Pavlovales sp. CCMP2436]